MIGANYPILSTNLDRNRYTLVRMESPNPPISLMPMDGDWLATAERPDGPVTAVGDSPGEAMAALNQLLVLGRALQVTLKRARA